jgi:hypothetical protein
MAEKPNKLEGSAMKPAIEIDRPWKTERVKRGTRMIEIQKGDDIRIGDQVFRVVQRLGGGRIMVRNVVDVRRG